MAALSFFCCPGGRPRVSRSAVVTGLSLRDGLKRYVPVRRFVFVVFMTDQPWPLIAFTLFGAGLVLGRHRTNVARLRAGTEHRLNLRGARS